MPCAASPCQRLGLAVGSGVGEAEVPTVDKGDGTAVGVPLTSALTLQSRRSTSSRVWMDCSRRTMSSSCWRFTVVIAGPTSLKIVATSWASLITRTHATLTRALAPVGALWLPAADGVAGEALGTAEKLGVLVSSRPTMRTP